MRHAPSRSRAKTTGLGMSRTAKGAIHVPHASPDTYRLGVLPRPLPVVAVLRRPKERFVMVNLLVFKKAASKPHEGRSGREAYVTYAATVERTPDELLLDLTSKLNRNLAEGLLELLREKEPGFFESVVV